MVSADEAPLKVAVLHYWLVAMRGGERVLERVLQMFPQADLFTHVYNPDVVTPIIKDRRVRTTFIDRLPASRKLYQKYLPLMPFALEQIDLRGYDLVLSFEAGPMKGVVAPPDALHVCYCHSPMRYLWDAYPEYRDTAGGLSRAMMSLTFPALRVWDHATAARVDGFIANSDFIRRRIQRAYRRDAVVVHPPVPTEAFTPSEAVGEEYLWVGQTTPYKRGDIAVEAFNRLGLPLRMVGRGEMLPRLKRIAQSNIRFDEGLSFRELGQAYAQCKALVYTAEEDFGIIPVEANAAGRPVLAYGRGGVLDSIAPGRSGLFFDAQTPEALVDGVRRLESWIGEFSPEDARAQAGKFASARFDAAYLAALHDFALDRPHIKARLPQLAAGD